MLKSVLFIGSKQLGLSILKTIFLINKDVLKFVVTYDDRLDNRSCLIDFSTFAKETKIPILVLDKPSQLKKVIADNKPDMVIVVGWYWLIKEELLNLVPFGFIGLHASLLPKYRGFAPLVWAILNGDKKTGISMFYFDNGIDSGDILVQESINIRQNDSIADIIKKVEIKSIDLFKKTYPLLVEKKAKRIQQNHKEASHCSIRKPENGRINWNISNIKIHNFIRAQSNPYPGAFSFIDDKKYFFLKTKIYNKEYYGVPGIISQVVNDGIIVCCGKGAIIITDIRLPDNNVNIVKSLTFGKQFIL